MLSVPALRTKESICRQTGLPLKRVSEVLEFLERSSLITFKNGKYAPGAYRTHLGKDSPMITKHHVNWRVQSIQSIERQNEQDLHYSSVVSLSAKDMQVIKERIVQVLQDIAKVIEPSPEEKVCSLAACRIFLSLLRSQSNNFCHFLKKLTESYLRILVYNLLLELYVRL